jgi:hypothetical protein
MAESVKHDASLLQNCPFDMELVRTTIPIDRYAEISNRKWGINEV